MCGIYLFGKVRRTDWRPVRPYGDDNADENYRGSDSDTDKDSASEEEAYRYDAHYPAADGGHYDESDSASEDSFREREEDYGDDSFEAYLEKGLVRCSDSTTGGPIRYF